MLRLTLALALLTACTEDPAATPEPPTATDPDPEPDPDPDPEPAPEPEPETLHIRADDGVTLVGDLVHGATARAPLVVLLHQLSTNRSEWAPLQRRLAEPPALATFAFDMRGHGESTARGDETIDWEDFVETDWHRLPADVRAVLAHLRARDDLDPSRVILVGSSIGSSAVILAAHDAEVDAVVALSPGRAYHGLATMAGLEELALPMLFVASRGEAASAETAEAMAHVTNHGRALLVDGDRHGVGMFESAPASLDEVAAFVRAEAQR